MQEEIDALECSATWTVEDLPPGKKAIGSGWVYKIKYIDKSIVERLKGRLVVYANRQVEGVDYNETFAPVAKMGTFRLFLSVAVSMNWELHQMDVHNAFLHGDLEEEALRQWFAKLSSALKVDHHMQITHCLVMSKEKTKKQPIVSRSVAEVEYRSMAVATCELKWLKSLLSSLGVMHSKPMQLFCDSQSTLHIAKNPVFHDRTKHIEVDCHFVRDEILKGNVSTSYVPIGNQLVDILTKALGRQHLGFLMCKLGIRDLHAPT
ncbi:uncharacterized protein [Spinacia oleracea]|uniref:Reverse transcriptase Ty1/copia-type domain-containing protein n=1 Tax=Spinacia oleracea TaxID=3562 RepID=A0ABM3RPJ4_SPIOL|nr:uncharacterized protein LOC130471443 [Spinacia oleracea]